MKKTLLVLVAAMLTSMLVSAQITDTIVSTTPSNRNVLLEEYTGINCGYCPDGHRIANQIQAANPDRVFVINIHAGSYAANTYTTQFGNALANQTGLTGYPSGTVNRHVFSGTKTALDRDKWSARANQIMGMSSPVNIAAEGTLDMTTRMLNVRVQLYYTGSQTVTSNMLNIAIIQDNVLGPQGGSSYNPAQVVNGQYNHMHMLRHLITGQWGETINTIAAGTLVEKTYEYEIPYVLGSPNAIDAWLEDLHFIAFVCEGHQEVLTATEIPVQRINQPLYDGRIMDIAIAPNAQCNEVASASFDFKNTGLETITSVEYTCTINGVTQTATWNGSVAVGERASIQTPDFSVVVNTNCTLNVQITRINEIEVSTSPKNLVIKKNVYTGGGHMLFQLKTDNYGKETTFKFFDPNGNVVLSGGPFNNNSSVVHDYVFSPATVGCYYLEVYDQAGDGINGGYGVGYFLLKSQDGTQIFRDNGKFKDKATYMIDVAYPAGIEEIAAETAIYPNPATDVININTTQNVQRVEIFNMQGQLVKMEAGSVNSISVKNLANGLYTMKLTTDNGVSVHKIVKK